MSGLLQEFSSDALPADILHRIAEKYRDDYYGMRIEYLFDDLCEYLRKYCYKDVDLAIFKIVRNCLPKYWDVFIPPAITVYNVSNRLPCLHEAIEIAHKFCTVKDDIHHNKLLFESAFVAIRYILEIKRMGTPSTGQIRSLGVLNEPFYPIATFFNNYEDVRKEYSKNMYYEDEKLAFKKPRYPEGDGLDENEKRALIYFSNLTRITLPLILNLKSKRKPVTHIVESLVGGNERKIQSGSGVTDFSRRRFTIFEDESGVMPISNNRQVIKPETVVEILKTDVPQKNIRNKVEDLCFKAGLNNALTEQSTYEIKLGNGISMASDEFSSKSNKSVISITEISKDGNVILENVKYMQDLSEIIDFGEDIQNSPLQSETKTIEDFLGDGSKTQNPIDLSNMASIEIGRQMSLRTVLTLNNDLALDDFELFSFDFGDRLLFADDETLID